MTEIYRDDYMVIRHHQGTRVAVRGSPKENHFRSGKSEISREVQVGQDPDAARPTIVDAVDVVQSLNEFLRSEESDG